MKKQKEKSYYRYVTYALLGVTLIVFLLVMQIRYRNSFSDANKEEQVYILNEFKLTTPSNKDKIVTLPHMLQVKEAGSYTLTTILPEEINLNAPVLLLKTKHYDYRVYLENHLLYTYSKRTHLSAGKRFTMITLPKHAGGKELEIILQPNIRNRLQLELKEVVLGDGYVEYRKLLKVSIPVIAMLVIIMSFGVFTTILSFLFRGVESLNRLKYVGGFGIIFSTYLLSTEYFIHSITNNSYYVYVIEYVSFMMLPIVILKLFISEVEMKFEKLFRFLLYAVYANIFLQIIVYTLEVAEFAEMVVVTRSIDFVAIVAGIIAIMASKNRRALKRLIPFFVGVSSYFILYFVSTPFPETIVFLVGVFLYIIVEIVELLKKVLQFKIELNQTGLYRKLAYIDKLTGVYNRNALMEDITIYNMFKETNLWCVFVDINNLKEMNDTMGHSYGDDMIRQTAHLLEHEFDRCGKVYRMGGDEFVVFILNTTKSFVEEKIKHLNYQKKLVNRKNRYQLSYAIGYDYQRSEEKVEDLISRVDELMYINKKNEKDIKQ